MALRRDVPPAVPSVVAPPPAKQQAPAPARAVAPQPEPEPYQLSPEGTKWRPSSRVPEGPRGSGADWANAQKFFRSPTIGDWMARMGREPEVYHRLLSDILRETRAEALRREGRAKIGRRPRVIDGTLSELWAMITPRYANEPFAQSARALVGDASPADVEAKTKIAAATFERMLGGQDITMWRLEALARGYEVSPAYFAEWRRSYVLTVVDDLLNAHPGLSVRYARALRSAIKPEATSRSAKPARRQPIAVV